MVIEPPDQASLAQKCETLVHKLFSSARSHYPPGIPINTARNAKFINASSAITNGREDSIMLVKGMAKEIFEWAEMIESRAIDEKRRRNLSVDLSKRSQWDTVVLAADVLTSLVENKDIEEPKGWKDFIAGVKQQKARLADVELREARSHDRYGGDRDF